MKLLRYGLQGQEKPALLDDQGVIRDLSQHVQDINPTILNPEQLHTLSEIDPIELLAVEGQPRIGPCLSGVGKFICIGLNYTDHALESGQPIPSEPVVFMKATSSIVGPNDDIVLLPGSTKTDWEVELGIVMGSDAKNITESESLDYVAGYCIVHDVSEREWQMERGGQWVKGKSADTYGPIGPWLVTGDEINNPQELDLWLEVNGIRHQDANTRTMIFSVAEIVSYLSQCMSLQAGDIIATGTPKGVGLGMKPPVYLSAGDEVRLSVEGLGTQQQNVVLANA
ncbi:MAG: 2-hydroxyhepta-2,4-diene-1,7-dioate isomerase [Acidiferrobacteraceae bacterium]|nr:2-hydroxyhepta-2,4-diene-1,7-dioate isomerase [Acidiferrobacteraceae bacterium]